MVVRGDCRAMGIDVDGRSSWVALVLGLSACRWQRRISRHNRVILPDENKEEAGWWFCTIHQGVEHM